MFLKLAYLRTSNFAGQLSAESSWPETLYCLISVEMARGRLQNDNEPLLMPCYLLVEEGYEGHIQSV